MIAAIALVTLEGDVATVWVRQIPEGDAGCTRATPTRVYKHLVSNVAETASMRTYSGSKRVYLNIG